MWIKICGIRDVDTAIAVAQLRPQAIGLNFYERSVRYVTPDVAAEIVRRLPKEVEPIGLFVNHSAEQIRQICRESGLRTIQLHGDEPPELLAELSEFQILRAFRIGDGGLHEVTGYLGRCLELNARPRACLADAKVAGYFGGTGQVAPWEILHDWRSDWPPLVLAGGLTPENVADGIKIVRPRGVDVAGGVESSPGKKDLALVKSFIERASGRLSPSSRDGE